MEACGDISFARHHVNYFLCVSLVGGSLDKLKDCAFSRRNRTWSLDFSVFWQSDLISDGKGGTSPQWFNFCVNHLSILCSTPNRWCFRDFRDAVKLLLIRGVFLSFLPAYLLQAPVLDPCTFPFPWPVDYSLVREGFIFLWGWREEKKCNSICLVLESLQERNWELPLGEAVTVLLAQLPAGL